MGSESTTKSTGSCPLGSGTSVRGLSWEARRFVADRVNLRGGWLGSRKDDDDVNDGEAGDVGFLNEDG